MAGTIAHELKPIWADHEMRLDPRHLPQAVSYASVDDLGEVELTIDQRGVRMRRVLEQSALPVTFILPPSAFRGVAARAMEEDGIVLVTLELLHNDPKLSVPLLVANNLDDIAADWRSWSEAYGLPMMMVESDGVARNLDDMLGSVKADQPTKRRQGSTVRHRRPRFLARRNTGSLGVRLVVDGNELIAWD